MNEYQKLEWIHSQISELIDGVEVDLKTMQYFIEDLREPYLKEISGLRQCQVCKNSYNIYEDESKMIMDIREILECPEKMIEKWESKNKDICLHDWFCSECATDNLKEISGE